MTYSEILIKILAIVSNAFTIFASAIAIYLFLFKKETVSRLFRLLLNYSYQLTFSELRAKLDRLNDLRVSEPTDMEEIINLFNEIVGQLRGNKKLGSQCSGCLRKLSGYADHPTTLTEPKKRSIVWELRESLRHIELKSFNELIGE